MSWRVGGTVPLNVYEYDRPMFKCHTSEDAARVVAILNSVEALRKERDELLQEMKWIAEAGIRENEMLRVHNVVFDKWPKIGHPGTTVLDGGHPPQRNGLTPEEWWQALGFTLHTNLWEIATKAQLALPEGPSVQPAGEPK